MPGSIPDHARSAVEALDHMQFITRWIHRRSRSELEPLGLTTSQVRALLTIQRLAERASGHGAATAPNAATSDVGSGVRMGGLARALDVVPRSATDVVEALEAAGLAQRKPDPGDGRATVVELTNAGRRSLDGFSDRRRAAAAEVFIALDPTDLDALADLLGRVAEPLRQRTRPA